MTVVCAIRVTDGLVLGADSRTSLVGHGRRGPELVNSYRHARKLFPLDERWMACTWGAGSIGGIGFANLLATAMADAPEEPAAIADHLQRACNRAAADPHLGDHNPRPDYGILLAGYGPQAPAPCWFLLEGRAGRCGAAQPLDQRLFYAGDGCAAIDRLLRARCPEQDRALHTVLRDHDLERQCRQHLDQAGAVPLVHPEMPLGDAVDLLRFLLEACLGWARFVPGEHTVGGQAHIATLDRLGGFSWATPIRAS